MAESVQDSRRYIWWEKSIEYKFIAEMVRCDMLLLAVPLDGNAETALGDLILQSSEGLRLIEFKCDVNSFASEYKKYSLDKDFESQKAAYEKAECKLSSLPGSKGHGLIYGDVQEGGLMLLTTPYWGAICKQKPIDWINESFVCQNDFEDYIIKLSVERFAASKSDDEQGSSGSRSFVVGVGNGGSRFTLELDEYINLRPQLKAELERRLTEEQKEKQNRKRKHTI